MAKKGVIFGKFCNIHWKTPVPESFFKLKFYLKIDPGTMVSYEFCKIFKNIFFTKHLCMSASILQQLLALYFAIIYSWQLSSSEKSLVRRKIHPYISRILQI